MFTILPIGTISPGCCGYADSQYLPRCRGTARRPAPSRAGTPELVEIIDVRRAQIGLQRPRSVSDTPCRFRLIAVNTDVQLRHVNW